MKILQLPSFYLPMGGEFCRDQAVLLKNNGIDIDILANVTLPWKKYRFKIFNFPLVPFFSEEDGLNIFRKYSFRIPKSSQLNMKYWVYNTSHLFEKYLKIKGKPDLIHVHTCMWGGYVAYIIKKKYNIPYVITEHHSIFSNKSEFSKKKFESWHNFYLTKAYSNASYILPVSELITPKIKEFLQKDIPIKPLSNIIDTSFFYKKERNILSNEYIFFTANSYNPAKAYDILIKSFDIVSNEYPNVELRIAGKGFNNVQFIKLLNKIKKKEKIYFCGFLSPEEVRNELWKANAFVLASRAESQSIAVLEAMATGLPIVCTEVVPEEMITPEVGYQVKVDDVNALASAMIKMIKNVNNFNPTIISQHAQKIVNPENFVQQTKQIYQSILNSQTDI